MAGQLQDKIVIVTGAGSGIGRASAIALAREGAKVVVSDVEGPGANETAETIRRAGGEATFVPCDVTQDGEVQALVAETVRIYGRLDCAHNNAGIAGRLVETHQFKEPDFDAVINVNLKGVWLCMKHEIRYMLEHGGGAIVNTASIASMVAGSTAAYAASKHGVLGLTRQAAFEYGTRGIRVNAVSPGIVNTPMVRSVFDRDPGAEEIYTKKSLAKRFAEPEEIGEAVVFLCSDASSFMTGVGLVIDGGWTTK
ncbi:MAG: SDR family oxidoreductase [SAR202 cluster bacterium]|nr:SDR family oxidoreductase [SAR202 cluster bacterium]